MVLNSAFSGCRNSSLVCCTTIGTSLVITLENGVCRDRLGVFEVVEAKMTAAAWRNVQPIRAHRISVFVKQEYFERKFGYQFLARLSDVQPWRRALPDLRC